MGPVTSAFEVALAGVDRGRQRSELRCSLLVAGHGEEAVAVYEMGRSLAPTALGRGELSGPTVSPTLMTYPAAVAAEVHRSSYKPLACLSVLAQDGDASLGQECLGQFPGVVGAICQLFAHLGESCRLRIVP
jgi:hypothetical protein